MTTEQEIIDTLAGLRIDWSATPQSFLELWHQEICTQEDFERSQRQLYEDVGRAYWFIHVQNMEARLALFYSRRPGYWETMLIPQRYSPLLPEDLERSVEGAGGALNWSGHYPLDGWSLEKVRLSYLGARS